MTWNPLEKPIFYRNCNRDSIFHLLEVPSPHDPPHEDQLSLEADSRGSSARTPPQMPHATASMLCEPMGARDGSPSGLLPSLPPSLICSFSQHAQCLPFTVQRCRQGPCLQEACPWVNK